MITHEGLPCELVTVEEHSRSWRIIVRDVGQRVFDFDVNKDSPRRIRKAIRAKLDLELP